MDLGCGSNTDGTGIGASRYATDTQPPSAATSLSPCADPMFSSLPALPLTMSYGSPSPIDVAMLSSLEDISSGKAIPLLSSPSCSHGSVTSSSNLDDTSMIDGCQAYRLVDGKETYDSLEEVAGDIRPLGKPQNNCLDEIVSMKGEIRMLKGIIARLERDSVAHEVELVVRRGEPIWGSREKIRVSVHVEAAKRMKGDVTPSPSSPFDIGVPSQSDGKQVSFDESSLSGFDEVGRKPARSHRANRKRKEQVAGPPAAKAPAPTPIAIPVPSLPMGAAMHSLVVAAPPPPPVPHTTMPGAGQVRSQLVPSPPPTLVTPGASRARVPTSSPALYARERHITMCFDAGRWTQLPITPEAICICMNQTLTNLGRLSDRVPLGLPTLSSIKMWQK